MINDTRYASILICFFSLWEWIERFNQSKWALKQKRKMSMNDTYQLLNHLCSILGNDVKMLKLLNKTRVRIDIINGNKNMLNMDFFSLDFANKWHGFVFKCATLNIIMLIEINFVFVQQQTMIMMILEHAHIKFIGIFMNVISFQCTFRSFFNFCCCRSFKAFYIEMPAFIDFMLFHVRRYAEWTVATA